MYTEIYQVQLGKFELRIGSTSQLFRIEKTAAGLHTAGHDVVFRRVQLPASDVETVSAWQFYITKHNSSQEQLTVSLELLAEQKVVQSGPETGQNLLAVGLENERWQVHIGTEDEEVMAYRASCNDWMPPRLEPGLRNYELQIMDITRLGLRTTVPYLVPSEQFYFHYILAENPCRESVEYPGEKDISTWIAVERSKQKLEAAWQVYTKKTRP